MNVERLLFATDFSAPSREALHVAVEVANTWQAALTIVHAIEPIALTLPDALIAPSFTQSVAREVDRALEEWRVEAERLGAPRVESRRLDDGPAWRSIVEEARRGGHDLIVVGTHGRTGLRHVLLGSVAERVVRHAPCPVLVVRAKQPAVPEPL